MTPQQDSLSGVIICPAYWKGQRLRVNSFTVKTALIIAKAGHAASQLGDYGSHFLEDAR